VSNPGIFLVNTTRIVQEPGTDLLARRYAPLDLEPVEYPDPAEIIRELQVLEQEIQQHTQELLSMLCDLGYATEEELS
jgi:hypothetical protein